VLLRPLLASLNHAFLSLLVLLFLLLVSSSMKPFAAACAEDKVLAAVRWALYARDRDGNDDGSDGRDGRDDGSDDDSDCNAPAAAPATDDDDDDDDGDDDDGGGFNNDDDDDDDDDGCGEWTFIALPGRTGRTYVHVSFTPTRPSFITSSP
jgi:hypothetical protein